MLDYLSNRYCAVRPWAGDRLAFILTLSVGVMRTGGGRASEPDGWQIVLSSPWVGCTAACPGCRIGRILAPDCLTAWLHVAARRSRPESFVCVSDVLGFGVKLSRSHNCM
ncbi:hypothetical protein DL98DRAFT_156672 [Cadophora sp. DSE1049]|nr:hypothetical protein DL98DRAFT_156672 [Cadophora sp. DSE1049]